MGLIDGLILFILGILAGLMLSLIIAASVIIFDGVDL